MSAVRLMLADDLLPTVERILSQLFGQLRVSVPEAELHHIGATAIPGALTKGDLDVLLRVSAQCFENAVAALSNSFAVKQPENWTQEFASFGDDASYELPVGIQLVVKNSGDDFFLFLLDHFNSNPEALGEYNHLKRLHAANGPENYWKAKDEFLSKVLASGKLR